MHSNFRLYENYLAFLKIESPVTGTLDEVGAVLLRVIDSF
jgi:hypothetical protein